MERALVGLAQAHRDAVMPGHTHVQPAQPVLLAHHLLAYVEMLERDRGRLRTASRGPMSRRWGPARSRGPASRSTARPRPLLSGSRA